MVYRGRLWASRQQAVLVVVPGCMIISAYVLVHYHMLQYIIGSHLIAPELSSGLQHERCAKLLRSKSVENGEPHHTSLPATPAQESDPSQYQVHATLCDHQDEKDSAESAVAMLERLPQWFPPRSVENEVNETLKAIFRRLPKVEQLARDSTVFVTFTNGHYSDLMLNSVATLAALGLSVFVYCFDTQAVQLCRDLGIPYFTPPADRFMEAADFRQDRAKFLEMGVHKPEMVLRLFDEFHVRQVVLTDTDTVWLRDPLPYLDRHPAVDVFTTTDCTSHEADSYFTNGIRRCAHTWLTPAPFGWGINTGVTAYRDTPATRAFLADWRAIMLDPDTLVKQMDDQRSFTVALIEASPSFKQNTAFQRHPTDPHALYSGSHNELVTVVLPGMLFPGGKAYFDYRLHAKYGTHPYAIHATFQRYNNAGKRSRFREAGSWMLDPSNYYRGKFLTVANNVHAFLASMQASATDANVSLSMLHLHLLGASYQHAVLRDAYAVARVLQRTLVLPPLYAWCDWSPSSDVLHTCNDPMFEGEVPYQGPSDLYVNIEAMDSLQYIGYREWTFLGHPQVPRHTVWDRETVFLYPPGAPQTTRYGSGVNVVAGPSLDDVALRAQLSSVMDRSILHIDNLEPHSFAGFRMSQDNVDFERFHAPMRWEQKWCCMTENNEHKKAGHQHWFYIQPDPFTSGAPEFPWRVPVYSLPDFCQASHDLPLTRNDEPDHKTIWDLSTHPCNYFRSNISLPERWNMSVVQLPAPSAPSYSYSWSAFKLPGERSHIGQQPVKDPQELQMS